MSKTAVRDMLDDLVVGRIDLADAVLRVDEIDWEPTPADEAFDFDVTEYDGNTWGVVSADPRLTTEQYAALARAYVQLTSGDITSATESFKFNPKQPRDPNTGEWIDTIVGKLPDLPSTPSGESAPSPTKKSGKAVVPAVIYKKHADGAVVAESTTGERRVRWDAGKKKFVVEKPKGDGWVETDALTKTAAYAEMKKPGRWVEPGSSQTSPQTPSPAPSQTLSEKLKSAYESGYTVESELAGGLGSLQLEKLTLADGTSAIRKRTPNQDLAVRDVLASKLLNALGDDTFAAVQTGDNEVIMSFVEGETGNAAKKSALDSGTSAYDFAIDTVTRPGGRETALVDWLTFNSDRNDGNYFITPDGRVQPIDHGNTIYADSGVPSSVFVSYWMQPDTNGELTPRFTRDELADVRKRVMSVRDAYVAADRTDWHDIMLRRLDILDKSQLEKSSQTPEPSPAVVEPATKTADPIANMRAAYDAGFTVLKEFTAGNVADKVELLELSDGTRAVRKKATPSETTNEYLAGRIANAIGIDDIVTAQIDDQHVITTFIDGRTGNGVFHDEITEKITEVTKYGNKLTYSQREKIHKAVIKAGVKKQVAMPGGFEIGMLDWLTANGDRHPNNWIVTSDNRVRPIDHGNARFKLTKLSDKEMQFFAGKNVTNEIGVGSPFPGAHLGIKEISGLISTIKPKIPKSRLVDMKTKLVALRSDFAQSNALDKYDFVIRQIDRLVEGAK